jgi:fucose 4-O-acetylase-like acetyltransferase
MGEKRIYYLDNLKVFLTCLVIAHHSAHGYGNIMGDWIYSNHEKTTWLYNFIVVNASFIMGLFFMISGYFIPMSFKNKSIKEFIISKTKRLILPVFFILIIIVPIYFYIGTNFKLHNIFTFWDYYINVYWKMGKFSYEHGWFLVHLFLYSMVYALARDFLKNTKFKKINKLRIRQVCMLAVVIGSLFFIVRFNYPTDKWITLFGFIGMEPAHIAQYLFFFALGILAYHNDWFNNIDKKRGWFFIISGILMALITYFNVFIPRAIWKVIWNNWGFYESFMGIFISMGLIFIFREYLNNTNKFWTSVAKSAFIAYIVHNMFVVIFQVAFDGLVIGPSLKFAFVTILSIITSFGVSILFRKISIMILGGLVNE